MFQDPILVIAFNKPSLLDELLEFLSQNTLSDIYIHLDGPTSDNSNRYLNDRCKQIIQNFESNRKNTFIFSHSTNLGGQFGVLRAIDWFFSNVTFGLILEEDISISPLAFEFISRQKKLLQEPQIFAICLFNPIENLEMNLEIDHWLPWGWATNSHHWLEYRARLEDNSLRLRRKPKPSPACRLPVRFFLNSVLDKIESKQLETWDAQVHIVHISRGDRSIFPHQTLSKHKGNTLQATHADSTDWWKHLNFPMALVDEIDRINHNTNNIRFEVLWRMSWRGVLSHISHTMSDRLSLWLRLKRL